jgi:tRNA A-37 threonylcarbamoyl transferase component Bud32
MAWVETLPRFASLFRHARWDNAASFLGWTGILVNRHRHRQVEEVSFAYQPAGQARDSAESLACPAGFYLKKEFAVTWRDRLRNAWDGFGWCATAVREGAMLQALREAGVGCPEVAALGEDGRQAFVLTLAEPHMTELRSLLPTLDRDSRNRLADALGRELAKMHDAGFDHPDLFAKHILAGRFGAAFRFCILDWQRGCRRRLVPWRLRCRDLAVLDATLHEALASDRLRLRCLRAYCGATREGCSPLVRLARSIRAAAIRLREQRGIGEVGQLPVPARDQQFVQMQGERLLVVRSWWDERPGDLPDWLVKLGAPDAQENDVVLALANASGSGLSLQVWPKVGSQWAIPPLAHVLFRLQRFGVPAPRLLAVGATASHVFLLAQTVTSVPLAEAVAKLPPARRGSLLQQAGALIRRIHEAGYHLPPGDSWEHRLGIVPATGDVVLTKVEPLLRGATCWQELAPLEFKRPTIRLSRTEQLRFLHGYLRNATRPKARERQVVS